MGLRRWVSITVCVLLGACQSPPAAPVAAPTNTSAPTRPPALIAAPSPSPSPSPSVAASPTVARSPVPSPAAAPSPGRPATAAPLPTGASRVEILNAAQGATAQGDLRSAAALYERVINTPPSANETALATQAIDELARFRAAVVLLGAGREQDARDQLDELERRDPNGPMTRLGQQLWDQYGMSGQVRAACAQLQPQVATQAGALLATLVALGVNVDANSLCSLP